MWRRDFIAGLGGAAVAIRADLAFAELREGIRRIGSISPNRPGDPLTDAILNVWSAGLQALGWPQGSVVFETRLTGGVPEKTKDAAAELLALKVDLIVTTGPSPILALKDQSQTPVLFTFIADPVGLGIAESIAHPGGNFTGFTSFEPSMGSKWCELLKKLAPQVKRVVALYGPPRQSLTQHLYIQAMKLAVPSIFEDVAEISVSSEAEIDAALASVGRDVNQGIVVLPDLYLSAGAMGSRVIGLAAQRRVPVMYPFSDFAHKGGLVSYGIDIMALERRVPDYMDRLLTGTKPGDLPAQAPNTFDLVINLKTAKALGLDVPPTLLAFANDVIE